jgi:hypothetical protein
MDRRGRWLVTRSPKFNFLRHGSNGISHLVDNGPQAIYRHIKPPAPGTQLSWFCQVDFVAKGRMFDALHGGVFLAAC